MPFDPADYDVAAYYDGSISLICSRCGSGIPVTSEEDEMPTVADLTAAAELHHAGSMAHIDPSPKGTTHG